MALGETKIIFDSMIFIENSEYFHIYHNYLVIEFRKKAALNTKICPYQITKNHHQNIFQAECINMWGIAKPILEGKHRN